jgi:type II secretory pathway pseudopilin PulG
MMRTRPPPRGTTLIEAMIVVAMLGILLTAAVVAPEAPVLEAQAVLVRERARLWLDYEAGVRVYGKEPDPTATAALQAAVPRGRLQVEPQADGTTRLTVHYAHPTRGDDAVQVVVFAKRGQR